MFKVIFALPLIAATLGISAAQAQAQARPNFNAIGDKCETVNGSPKDTRQFNQLRAGKSVLVCDIDKNGEILVIALFKIVEGKMYAISYGIRSKTLIWHLREDEVTYTWRTDRWDRTLTSSETLMFSTMTDELLDRLRN